MITGLPYWRFLARPWKLTTFAVAAAGLIVIAPYTGDPTWDHVDAAFMSILAFGTAPWAVETLYRAVRDRVPRRQTFVALCVWLFSASWSYDLYLLVRDGHYPVTWWGRPFTRLAAPALLLMLVVSLFIASFLVSFLTPSR